MDKTEDNDGFEAPQHSRKSGLLGMISRRVIIVVLFAVVLLGCRWLAYQLRFDFNVPQQYRDQLANHWHWALGVQLLCLFAAGQFSGIFRYFSLPDIQRLAVALTASGALLYAIRWYGGLYYSPPIGVILIECGLGFLTIGAIRSGWRLAHEKYYSRQNKKCAPEKRVAIIGAGDAGASLICELNAHPRLGLKPVVMLDDNPAKWVSTLHGVMVFGPPEKIENARLKYRFEEVIIAMPSISAARLGEIVTLLQKAKLKYVTVPGIDQLTAGTVEITQLRPVKVEDLLGRDPVDLRLEEIRHALCGQVVMVTGAGGSIGSELCRQVASYQPKRLLLVERSEVQLFQIEQELIKNGYGALIQPCIADIVDLQRISRLLRDHRPSVIFHAAAHKHVPMMEHQPGEAVKNNSFGTARLADLALEFDVQRFVMISTDKAVNPTSVMGASKRLAEIYLQSLFRAHPDKTRFIAVRFGNVLGSSGSVVPIFEEQIASGGPVTVTHPDVMRYFMTIPEAVGLVLQSGAQGAGGEIFVLDMGKPVRIADLARQMVRLSGLEPDKDIEIKFTGLRPGEKLYEELKDLQANCHDTRHPRIKSLSSQPQPLERIQSDLQGFEKYLDSGPPHQFRYLLRNVIPEYNPYVPGDEPSIPENKAHPAEPAHCQMRTASTADPSISCDMHPTRAKLHAARPKDECMICSSYLSCLRYHGWLTTWHPLTAPIPGLQPANTGASHSDNNGKNGDRSSKNVGSEVGL